MAGRPITVGTDGSEESLRAVDWAAREAVLRSSPLRIVSVLALPPRASRYQPPGRPDAVAEAVRESYTAALATAARRAADAEPGLAVDTRLLPGPPARALAEATADASMLVVGSRGGRTVTGLVLGSVSRYAATHARCPVVVRRGDGKSAYREIVVGLGDLDQSAAALGFAFEEAALRQARLTVVHAWSCFLPGPGPGLAARVHDAVAGWQEKYPAVETGTDIMHAQPARLIGAASARADLVVLGRRPGGAAGPGGGSVIHAVLHHTRGPVAVVAG